TLSMAELADAFKKCQARALVFILDCCFSGGASARVLADSPAARAVLTSFAEVTGEGRIIIAASDVDEPAYELPGSGHGILTKALVDVLTAGDEPVNLITAMRTVMDTVRAEASKIGKVQT